MADSASPELDSPGTLGTYPLGTVASTHHGRDPSDSQTLVAADGDGIPFPAIRGYAVLDVLGKGGMGVVFKARDLRLGRDVAIKMVAGGPIVTDSLRARFQAEARAVALLQHPHIAQVYLADTLENRPYFVMEYVNGGPLSRQIRGKPKPPREAAELVAKLAEAIDFSHGKGVIHRDLKPANVLLQVESQPEGGKREGESDLPLTTHHSPLTNQNSQLSTLNPKIADFGLAKFLDSDSSSTRTGDILGTPSYMAPEQAGGVVKNIGPACDIYALGAILYELLTGRPPFQTPDAMQTVLMVLSEDPVPPGKLQPTVPRDLETICLKCLEKLPAKRYATAGDLAADLRRFLQGEPIHARPVGRWERGVKWVKRRPAWATLIGLCVLGLIGVFAGGYYHNRQVQSALDETTVQRDRAERMFDNGRKLANSLISKHFQELHRLPGGRRAQEQLAAELAVYLDRLGRDAQDDTALLEDVAEAYITVADVQGGWYQINRGARQDALKNYRKALEILERLIAAQPGELNSRLQRERCRIAIIDSQFQTGDVVAARAQYGECLTRLEALRSEFPQIDRALRLVIIVTGRLGDVDEAEMKLESALKRYRAALELTKRIRPGNAEQRNSYDDLRATQHFRTGQLLEKLQRIDEAEPHYVKQYAYAKRLMNEDAASRWSQQSLALALIALGDVDSRRSKLPRARERYEEALQIRRRLARDETHADVVQEGVAIVLERLATSFQLDRTLDAGRRGEQTVPRFAEALKIRERLARRGANDVYRLTNLAVAQRQLAEVLSPTAAKDRAEKLFHACLETAARLEALQKGSLAALEFRAECHYGLALIAFARGEDAFVKSEDARAAKHYKATIDLLTRSLEFWKSYLARNPNHQRAKSLQHGTLKMKSLLEGEIQKRLKRAAERRNV